jgi:LacI family transcriptional regulator
MSKDPRRPPRRPTIRDVAQRAGVSFKTVSRVVNGEGGVSPELVTRVRAAVAELGYRRDPAASILRRGDARTNTIGVVLDDLANPFSAALHRAVVDVVRPRGVVVLSASSDEDAVEEQEAFAAFAERRVDGVVLMPTGTDHGWLEAERAAGAEIITVDRPAPGFDADCVLADNRDGAARATAHLLRRGHRRIAFLGDVSHTYTANERLAGYRDSLDDADVEFDDSLVRMGPQGSEAARETVIDLLTGPAPPTAIFTSQNLMTIGAVRALRQLGLHHEVALIGFDDVELADMLDPAITVVAQSPVEIGTTAAKLLLRRLDGDSSPRGTQVVPTRLIPRGSGEIAPLVRR